MGAKFNSYIIRKNKLSDGKTSSALYMCTCSKLKIKNTRISPCDSTDDFVVTLQLGDLTDFSFPVC